MNNENYDGNEPKAPKAQFESADSLELAEQKTRSESKASLSKSGAAAEDNSGSIKFVKNVDEASIEIGNVESGFSGMGKEEVFLVFCFFFFCARLIYPYLIFMYHS